MSTAGFRPEREIGGLWAVIRVVPAEPMSADGGHRAMLGTARGRSRRRGNPAEALLHGQDAGVPQCTSARVGLVARDYQLVAAYDEDAWTREQALEHWGEREDSRARLYTAAIRAVPVRVRRSRRHRRPR